MLRVLVLAGTVSEYYAWLREHKIGWVEAVYVNDPTRLRIGDRKIPLIKTGTWQTQAPDTIAAADAYLKIYEEQNREIHRIREAQRPPTFRVEIAGGVDLPAAAVPVSSPPEPDSDRARTGGREQATVAA